MKDGMTSLVLKQRQPTQTKPKWTKVIASDGKEFTNPGLANWYMKHNNLKGKIKFE